MVKMGIGKFFQSKSYNVGTLERLNFFRNLGLFMIKENEICASCPIIFIYFFF